MNAVDLIARKRDGASHTAEEIDFFVAGVTGGSIPDYQIAAWLMAVCWRGMTDDETARLTQAMAASGQTLNLRERWPNVVDKHSTGGVGDKTTLVLAPMLAAVGLRVAKMSGRGLGFSGGTLDKLESIPGLRVGLTNQELIDQVERIGLAICSQSADLAPADGKLYALRDVTATVDSRPLIAASVMSKKLALGAARLVLDVKVGSGAFMKTMEQAQDLGQIMVTIGQSSGLQTSAVISEMNQPEGYAIGNALEVREAIAALQGEGPTDVLEICLALGRQLGAKNLEKTIRSGAAFDCFKRMVAAQGGDVRSLDEPDRLPAASLRREVPSRRSGYVLAIDAQRVARACMLLGAARTRKEDAIDPATGIVLRAKVGDWVDGGQPLGELHANSTGIAKQAAILLDSAYEFSEHPVAKPPMVKAIIS